MGSNWIETVPDKAWFAYFRFCGPTEGISIEPTRYRTLRRSSARSEVRF
jgi:hypothetical protein